MAIKDNLISVWELDEASGNAIDSHGSNDLTETSGTIASATGKVGGARDFEATGDTEYFELATNSSLETGDIDFSVSAWVNAETLSNFPVIVHKSWGGSGANREWVLYYDTSASRFTLVKNAGGTAVQVAASTFGAASTATWYWLNAYHDSVNNEIGISVNNGTVDTTSTSTGVSVGTGPFQIGSSPAQVLYWDGLIDQVALWKKVLSSGDRTAIYNGGSGLAYSSWDAAVATRRRQMLHSL